MHPLFKKLAQTYINLSPDIEFPHLKAITLAQWVLEAGRNPSDLAREHFNFGGLKWRIEDYQKAITLAPNNADVYYAWGFTLALQGKKKEAIEAYQKAEELYREHNKPKYSQNTLKKIEELKTSESS